MSIFNFGVIGVIFLRLFQYLVNPYFLRPPYKVIKLVFSKHMHATNCQIFLTRDSKCTCTNVVFPDPAIPRHKIHVGFSFWNSELAASSPLSSDIDGPAKELLSPPLASAILELREHLIRHTTCASTASTNSDVYRGLDSLPIPLDYSDIRLAELVTFS